MTLYQYDHCALLTDIYYNSLELILQQLLHLVRLLHEQLLEFRKSLPVRILLLLTNVQLKPNLKLTYLPFSRIRALYLQCGGDH